MSQHTNNDTTSQLGVSPIGQLLLKFSIPSIIAMIANALYNVIDSIFVGRGVGSLALTAVTVSFPIMLTLMAFGMLIGIGSTALISIKLGQQQYDEAERIFGNAFASIIALSLILTVTFQVFIDPILVFLGATPDVFDYAKQFSSIIIYGSAFQFISFGINNIIRAEGKPMISMITMLFSAGMNTILNPLFIFVFDWGIKGSALATVTTQILVSSYIIYHFTLGKSNLKLRKKYFKLELSVLSKIAAIGLAPFLLQLAASVTTFLFNSTLLIYGGEMAVAAMGVISRATMMILMPIFGINQGVQPIIGYNYGARKFDRVKRALYLAIIAATCICVFGFAIIQLFSYEIIRVFNDDAEMLRIGVHGIRLYLMLLPVIGIQIVITNYFQSINQAVKSIFLSMSRQVLFLIPLIIIMPKFLGLDGIWIAGASSDFLASFLSIIMLIKEFKRLKEINKKEIDK